MGVPSNAEAVASASGESDDSGPGEDGSDDDHPKGRAELEGEMDLREGVEL